MEPEFDKAALVDELKQLRRGLGVHEARFGVRVGEAVRGLSGVVPADPDWQVADKVRKRLGLALEGLPPSARELGRIALGFDAGPDAAAERRYLARLESLTTSRDRDVRTLQRRSDETMVLLADRLLAKRSGDRAPGAAPWHTARLGIGLVLDGTGVDVLETRTIVSHVDGLAEIDHSLTIAPADPTDGPLDLARLGIRAMSGGDVVAPRLVRSNRVEFGLRPPRPLAVDQEHQFGFTVRVARMSPFYFCTPQYPCELFDLRVKFDRTCLPTRVWVVRGAFSHEASDPASAQEEIEVDGAGEVHRVFDDLEPYRSYGVLWEYPPAP